MGNKLAKQLQVILDKSIDKKRIFGTIFCIQHDKFSWIGGSGNLNPDAPFFIASTTKLFITALVLNLQQKGLLKLDNRISTYLPKEVLLDLHTFEGVDYTYILTIKNLLAHTSGIPDYFQIKGPSEKSLIHQLLDGNDQSWTPAEAISISKSMRPLFIPNTVGKAHYSDTNYQLLELIIEKVTGQPLAKVLNQNLFAPLQLESTYLYTDCNDSTPNLFYYKDKPLEIPQAMSSFRADGGIVSTAKELMRFLHAFFNGTFFPESQIAQLTKWNPIFSPLQAGIGIHQFKLPWIFDPTGKIPELIGHSGLSGTVAFYSPKEKLYLAGTVNQVAHPDLAFKLAIRLIKAIQKGSNE
ncbi:serine hydrolase domain-containing protein [Sunxiuqinia elliptica]|uniref:CubicO group peptidase (Beta-lactamase class C family) n=1 Tax=Sunxiuqinia elliptica TaxID=655355 RepID=A0A4R6GN74_9BACT|nr:serine hydrolase domain-containing protein [Sunxiuqinia elliptica]TDN96669.1 CubicO group peptidase (beta-lactamase class C family) [Sunxiuqinia elliptica]TDO55772.1 CubicO group peptidase (beta-lactamase class C family) [Sunxiuqinia elliptica]